MITVPHPWKILTLQEEGGWVMRRARACAGHGHETRCQEHFFWPVCRWGEGH